MCRLWYRPMASVPASYANVYVNRKNKTTSFLKFHCQTVQLCYMPLQLPVTYLVCS